MGVIMIIFYIILLIAVFLYGYSKGRLSEMDKEKPQELETPFPRVKKASRVMFTNQLDPVVPENTKRAPLEREVLDDRDD